MLVAHTKLAWPGTHTHGRGPKQAVKCCADVTPCGGVDAFTTPETLTFTAANWQVPQKVERASMPWPLPPWQQPRTLIPDPPKRTELCS